MINTRNATLNQRPKAFNAVGVDIPIHIDFGMVVNSLMSITNPSHSIIGGEFVSVKSVATGPGPGLVSRLRAVCLL